MATKNVNIYASIIDELTKTQIEEIADHPAVNEIRSICIMPDAHPGAGCVIGFTGFFNTGIIPNVVGVDIGCGVACLPLNMTENEIYNKKSLSGKDFWDKIDKEIRVAVPCGMTTHKSAIFMDNIEKLSVFDARNILIGMGVSYKIQPEIQLGTLGGGNHFIEIDQDKTGKLYLIVHSGSRNFGYKVGNYFQSMAKILKDIVSGKITKIKESKNYDLSFFNKDDVIEIKKLFSPLVSTNVKNGLEYLPFVGENIDFKKYRIFSAEYYIECAKVAMEYAEMNRRRIVNTVAKIITGSENISMNEYFESVHNYIEKCSFDTLYLVRKGAISAEKDQPVLIPLSMKDGVIIGTGKGNYKWNYSAPHGAGRLSGRSQMKKMLETKVITMENFKDDMQGIYSNSVTENTIDESSFAYKPPSAILDMINPTVDVKNVLKPLFNLKDI